MRFTELTVLRKCRQPEFGDCLHLPAAARRYSKTEGNSERTQRLPWRDNTARRRPSCKYACRRVPERIVERVHVLVDPFSEGPNVSAGSTARDAARSSKEVARGV